MTNTRDHMRDRHPRKGDQFQRQTQCQHQPPQWRRQARRDQNNRSRPTLLLPTQTHTCTQIPTMTQGVNHQDRFPHLQTQHHHRRHGDTETTNTSVSRQGHRQLYPHNHNLSPPRLTITPTLTYVGRWRATTTRALSGGTTAAEAHASTCSSASCDTGPTKAPCHGKSCGYPCATRAKWPHS